VNKTCENNLPQVPVHTANIRCNMDFDLWYLRFLFKSFMRRRYHIGYDGFWPLVLPEVSIQVLTIEKRRSKVRCGTGERVMRCWQCIAGSVKDKASVINGGQHGYIVETLFQSTAERKQPKTRRGRIKHDMEWLFCETCSPFQMGAKTWNIDGSPSVKNRAGVNPITMDCKMNECYSADP